MSEGEFFGAGVTLLVSLLLLIHAYTSPERVKLRREEQARLMISKPTRQLMEDFKEFWLPVSELADLYNQQQLKEIHDAVMSHGELATRVERAYTLRKMRDAVDNNVGL